VARDECSGYTLGRDVVKQVLKDGDGIELARAADSRAPRHVLVHFIAQKYGISSRRLQCSIRCRSLAKFSRRLTSISLKNTMGSKEV
jgi:N-acetylglucosamine kinase-like BadF-type ATPase